MSMARCTRRHLTLATLLAACLCAARAEEPAFMAVEQRAEDFASFCRFVEEEYAYFDQKKTDWPRACQFHAPQATRASDRAAYIEVLEQALGELYDSHAHLGTNTRRSYRLVPTQTDLFATWKDGRAVISDVRAGSAAERAGLRPGMEVTAIDDEPVETRVTSLLPKFLAHDDPAAHAWALQVALAGRRDRETVRLRARAGSTPREFAFVVNTPEPSSPLSSRVIGGVGHLRIHNSLGQQALVPAFDEAIAAMPDVRALVIDLRDTPSGGNSTVARGIMGHFVDRLLPYQRHELIAEFRATGVRRVWDEYVAPRGTAFRKPVVVLVGRWTGSMGEGLAIGLNATHGALVLGQPMAHLLGANGETVLPHSKIVVRVPTEKLFHIDGTPREAVIPCAAVSAPVDPTAPDQELASAVAWAAKLGAPNATRSLPPTCHGLRPPQAARPLR